MSNQLAPGDLLTAHQALTLLPVGKSTLFRLIDAGEISCVRVGSVGARRGRVLIPRAALEEFVERRHTGATGRTVAPVNANDILANVRRRGST